MHVHLRVSKLGNRLIQQIVESALSKGLDGIVLLDHGYHTTDEDVDSAKTFNSKLKVFRGCELDVVGANGSKSHLVIVCDHPYLTTGRRPVPISELKEVARHLERYHGFSILAHPYRKGGEIAIRKGEFHPDAVEFSSPHTDSDDRTRARIMELAMSWDMAMVSTSDAHKPQSIGSHYIETWGLAARVNSEADLAHAVCMRRFIPYETKVALVEFPTDSQRLAALAQP